MEFTEKNIDGKKMDMQGLNLKPQTANLDFVQNIKKYHLNSDTDVLITSYPRSGKKMGHFLFKSYELTHVL